MFYCCLCVRSRGYRFCNIVTDCRRGDELYYTAFIPVHSIVFGWVCFFGDFIFAQLDIYEG